jgi:hypothetical protein
MSRAGVGLALEQATRDTLCYVADIQPGGSASASGLVHVGDKIISIDRRNVSGLPLCDVGALIAGPPGSVVTIGLVRITSVLFGPEKEDLIEIQLMRGQPQQPRRPAAATSPPLAVSRHNADNDLHGRGIQQQRDIYTLGTSPPRHEFHTRPSHSGHSHQDEPSMPAERHDGSYGAPRGGYVPHLPAASDRTQPQPQAYVSPEPINGRQGRREAPLAELENGGAQKHSRHRAVNSYTSLQESNAADRDREEQEHSSTPTPVPKSPKSPKRAEKTRESRDSRKGNDAGESSRGGDMEALTKELRSLKAFLTSEDKKAVFQLESFVAGSDHEAAQLLRSIYKKVGELKARESKLEELLKVAKESLSKRKNQIHALGGALQKATEDSKAVESKDDSRYSEIETRLRKTQLREAESNTQADLLRQQLAEAQREIAALKNGY